MQGKMLKKLLGLPKSTPYWGLLIERGMWPVEGQLRYKKAMLLHNLVHSDDNRVAKRAINDQKLSKQPNCFYSEVQETLSLLGIRKEPEKVQKSEWKKVIKDSIMKKVRKVASVKRQNMTKLRFVGELDRQKYVTELTSNEARQAICIRLNMTKYLGGNIGQETSCKLCEEGEETTEHVFECKAIDNTAKLRAEDLAQTDTNKMTGIIKLFKKYEEAKKAIG